MKKRFLIIGVGLMLVAGGVAWLTSSGAFRTRPTYPLELVAGDTVSSWNFAGAYGNDPLLRKRATDEIQRINALFGKEGNSDYILYVSIANQYDLLGDGAQELSYLQSALAIDATSTGLAWYNVGQLLDRLNAVQTARRAFEKAAEVQPIPQYVVALRDFLQRRSFDPQGQKK